MFIASGCPCPETHNKLTEIIDEKCNCIMKDMMFVVKFFDYCRGRGTANATAKELCIQHPINVGFSYILRLFNLIIKDSKNDASAVSLISLAVPEHLLSFYSFM